MMEGIGVISDNIVFFFFKKKKIATQGKRGGYHKPNNSIIMGLAETEQGKGCRLIMESCFIKSARGITQVQRTYTREEQ
jgi:hypothetical protein